MSLIEYRTILRYHFMILVMKLVMFVARHAWIHIGNM